MNALFISIPLIYLGAFQIYLAFEKIHKSTLAGMVAVHGAVFAMTGLVWTMVKLVNMLN